MDFFNASSETGKGGLQTITRLTHLQSNVFSETSPLRSNFNKKKLIKIIDILSKVEFVCVYFNIANMTYAMLYTKTLKISRI